MTAQSIPAPDPLELTLSQAMHESRLGLRQQDDFKPVKVSLTPLEVSASQWKMANVTAMALGTLFLAITRNRDWLHNTLRSSSEITLANHLLTLLPPTKQCRATNVHLCRHDLMLDDQANWKLVEANSIAAGMGPFSEALGYLLAEHLEMTDIVPNPAAFLQAKAIYQQARLFCPDSATQPTIGFVVEANEDNVFDQQYIADALRALGAQVITATFDQLRQQSRIQQQHLVFRSSPIHALYFRTGYNLADYGKEQTQPLNLKFRASLETLNIALAPTITGQLATHKRAQMQLAAMNVDTLMRHFGLSTQQAIVCHLALSTPHQTIESDAQVRDRLASQEWLLKSDGEGGGQVQDRWSDSRPVTGSFLMKKIRPQQRPSPIQIFDGLHITNVANTQSEVGLFTVGDEAQLGGYLIRTKPDSQLETGVHCGAGVIDTVRILPR